MRIKKQMFPFQPGFGRKRADGGSLWLNQPIYIGLERLNSIIEYIKEIKTCSKNGRSDKAAKKDRIRIVLRNNWPEYISDIQSIIRQNISTGDVDSWEKYSSYLDIIIKDNTDRSAIKWYVDQLFNGGKYHYESDYSAKNDLGHAIKFVGQQYPVSSDADTTSSSSSSTISKKPSLIKKNPSATTIPDMVKAAQEAKLKEKSADGGINWWLVGGLIAAVVVIHLIVK